MSSQLERWSGSFGDEYTDRNVVDPGSRVGGFHRMLAGVYPASVLEVGTNRGHNLTALKRVFPDAFAHGVEPNEHARELARRAGHIVLKGSVYELPPWRYDLVFTCGVLEHVPPERLAEALTWLYGSAERWLLAVEYASDTDTEIEYRGQAGLLWKRDYGWHAHLLFPDMRLVRSGELDETFDRARFWLWRKP